MLTIKRTLANITLIEVLLAVIAVVCFIKLSKVFAIAIGIYLVLKAIIKIINVLRK